MKSGVTDMRFWYYFWTVNFIVAGGAFALIALVVAIRGVGDLRRMFAALKSSGQRRPGE
jgi:hypothetical protein